MSQKSLGNSVKTLEKCEKSADHSIPELNINEILTRNFDPESGYFQEINESMGELLVHEKTRNERDGHQRPHSQ